jgi:hypothetical protein
MACDWTHVFVLGGYLSLGARVDEAKLIHVLNTIMYFPLVISFGQPSNLKQSSSFTRNPTPTLSKHSEKPTQLAQKLSVGHPTQGQPQHGMSLHQILERRTVPFLSK